MSEQPKRLFIVTKQDELDYWKRKYHELLDYLEGKNMGEESKQETLEKEYHEWMRYPGGGVEVRRSDGTIIDAIGELERLISLLREAEAKYESAQKMCDHWEKKATERQGQVNEWKARAEKAEAELSRFMNMPSCSPELFLRSAQRAEKPAPIDWQRVRIDAAIAAMQGVLANPNRTLCTRSVLIHADALVAELQKKEVEK